MTWIIQMLARLLLACVAGMAMQARAAPKTVLILGDSLSAEYGLARGSGWVSLLEKRLHEKHIDASVINASISGETTSGGRTRLPALLEKHQPQVVVIELGGNDGLRGLPLAATQDNLRSMVSASQQAGARVLLLGMKLPPNYGRTYTEQFFKAYAAIAKQSKTALVPFFLEGLVEKPDLFQSDRIHPTAQAQPIMLNNVWPHLSPLLK